MGDCNDAFNRNNAAAQARTKAQNRANVVQLKLIGQSHPTGLTANLLKLFEPWPPLEYTPPPEKKEMSSLYSRFAEPGYAEYAPPVVDSETPARCVFCLIICQGLVFDILDHADLQQPIAKGIGIAAIICGAHVDSGRCDSKLWPEEGARKAAEELEKYDPSKDPIVTSDPYKTLVVARLNYETTDHQIKREFETYGPIKRQQCASGHSRSEESSAQDDLIIRWTGRSLKRGDGIESKNGRGPVNRERGNEHGRERERECGRDWGHGRERERECGRDRGHGRDKERERGCDNDRERDSRRERDQERERGYDQAGSEMDHGYSHGKEAGYGSESKHGRKGRAQGEEILSMEHYDHHQPHGLADSQYDSERAKRHEVDYYKCASYDKAQSDYYQTEVDSVVGGCHRYVVLLCLPPVVVPHHNSISMHHVQSYQVNFVEVISIW
ncbi:hypothetical protein OPV22_024457 [Ensete ventricosum]|uniref:RRM domain-containing protein n=1 Tax=Ensete ventricosum TaxID=4639 RepID=A0AAV8Q135_ENSVE|nr:hypothetical protein OPV22_024457 [Ensete ventricosum]